jgi:hypothetical protein
VNVSGLALTDESNVRDKSVLPPFSFLGVGPDGYQRFIADGDRANGADHANFKLDAAVDFIGLYTAAGSLIDSVAFSAQPFNVSQGRFPDGSGSFASFLSTRSPGAANYLPLANVVINELLSHTDPPLEDAVEFYNPSDTTVDISGWYLSNTSRDLRRFVVPPGTTIPARGYKVIYEGQFGTNGSAGMVTPFTFNSAHGDAAFLSQVSGGQLTGYRAAVTFGAAANGVSFGRFLTSLGADFVAMSRRTFGVDENISSVEQFRTGLGAANPYPLVGPIVINEIMYHPPTAGATNDNTLDEYIELLNITAGTVPLYDPAHATNAWELSAGVDFTFPTGVTVPPGGFVLVVNFDPVLNPDVLSAFRAKYEVPSGVPVLGLYGGNLDNGADDVQLTRPDPPQLPPHPDAGFVPSVLVDRVLYTDSSPWPTNADGLGASLQRRVPSNYANDPANWFAASPTAGRPNATNPTDNDGDGLPNDWELANDLKPDDATGVNGAAGDPDADGMSNLEEYLAGTNPKSASSYLKIASIDWSGVAVRLTFEAAPNKSYTLEYRDSAASGSWIKLDDFPAQSSPRTVEFADLGGPANAPRFYRLVTPQRP